MKLMLDITKNDFNKLNMIAEDLGLDVKMFCRKLLENTIVRRKEMIKDFNDLIVEAFERNGKGE